MLKKLHLSQLNFLKPFYNPETSSIECSGIYCSDLLSDVIAKAKPNQIWLTNQKHINIVAVASMKEFSMIVVCNGYNLDDIAMQKCRQLGVLAYSSNLDMYSTAIKFYKILGDF